MIDDDLEELWKEYRHLAAYTRHARLWLHEYDHDRLVRISDKVGALIEKLTRRQEARKES